jgi:hypothetical protein
MTIAEALDAEAPAFEGVERRTAGDALEWVAAGVTFAAVAGSSAEFRLSPAVAAAARDTPDAAASARGREWVAFSPAQLDRYALDRAIAWFGSAYRAAADASRQESKRPR